MDVENFDKDPIKFEHYSTYSWSIANKYYEADVDVCHVQQKNMIGQLFCEEVEAVVALFDSHKVHCSPLPYPVEIAKITTYTNQFYFKLKQYLDCVVSDISQIMGFQ